MPLLRVLIELLFGDVAEFKFNCTLRQQNIGTMIYYFDLIADVSRVGLRLYIHRLSMLIEIIIFLISLSKRVVDT